MVCGIRARAWFLASLLLTAAVAASGEVFFQETFDDDGWEQRWHKSDWKQDEGMAGEFVRTAGKWYGDEHRDQGIQTTPDARYFAIWSEMPEFSNKDRDLVIQVRLIAPLSPTCPRQRKYRHPFGIGDPVNASN